MLRDLSDVGAAVVAAGGAEGFLGAYVGTAVCSSRGGGFVNNMECMFACSDCV